MHEQYRTVAYNAPLRLRRKASNMFLGNLVTVNADVDLETGQVTFFVDDASLATLRADYQKKVDRLHKK
ncbi:hypothetical protein IV54_GL000809 [Levilactobacillus paucivorans]|uniref:Uncharacterized protein n=1 Tax=Levilactobacillus paucivorans TaxID=616990 RepID=A0A0R2LZC6_9LACO|nr:hypothetical protein [Levilactobacillus paucivorans]KRO04784.1 hypothetical protein IV54_GL000809 [Levilactobacillus paucivorans]